MSGGSNATGSATAGGATGGTATDDAMTGANNATNGDETTATGKCLASMSDADERRDSEDVSGDAEAEACPGNVFNVEDDPALDEVLFLISVNE